MSRVCSVTGAKPAKGNVIHRRGLAKKKGGVGRHVTKNVARAFLPNLKTRRIWVPELNKFVTVKLTSRALKTIAKNGAYRTLKEAGVVETIDKERSTRILNDRQRSARMRLKRRN
jgi:large subunit ribosomal protein L28